jgi:hypothetical protein
MKKIILSLLILAGAGYAIAFTKNAIFFYTYISLAAFVAYFILYFNLFHFALRKFDTSIEKDYKSRRRMFRVITVICFLFSVNVSSLIEHYFKVLVIKYLGFLAIFILSVIFGAALLRPNKKKIIKMVSWAVGSLLCILLLIFGNIYFFPRIQVSSKDQLKSLQYVDWAPAQDSIQYAGVIKYDKKKAYKGLNIYNSRNAKVTQIIDMEGNLVHRWSPEIKEKGGFHHILLSREGDLFAIIQNRYFIRLDWDGKIKWFKEEMAHHDIEIEENGDIYFISKRNEVIWYYGIPTPIANDYIVLYSRDGSIKKEISVYNIFTREAPITFSKFAEIYSDLFKPRIFLKTMVKKFRGVSNKWLSSGAGSLDIFHTNSLTMVNRDIPGVCKKGNLLISLRNINLVAIIDPDSQKKIWEWGPGSVIFQHHATLLEDSNILIFDNGSETERPYSRVVEVNPITKKIVWEYKSNPPEKFFSRVMGSCQRLPNGNTLITASESGYVFEVTSDGEIVWEFYNPELDPKEKTRATIYRFMRIIDPQHYAHLPALN